MAAPWFDIRRFGDLPRDGSADWSLVMQAAIDCLIRMHHVTGDPGTLYLPAGIYCINRPILLCRIEEVKAGAFSFESFSLSIVGERAGHLGDPQSGVVIHAHLRRTNPPITGFPRPFCMLPGLSDPCGVEGPPRLDRPALIIQGGQTVHLRGLTLCGLNHWIGGLPTRESILTQHLQEDPILGIDPYRIDDARDNAASPYAGICVDPFSPHILQDPAPGDPRRRYPNLETYYLPAVASRDLLIEDCQIHDFTVGVCLAPTGEFPGFREGEISLRLVNTTISVAKSCLSIGQHRRAALHGVNLGPAKYAINCVEYGGPGHAPSVHGARVKSIKHVLLTGPTGTSSTLSGLTVQDSLSLGQLGAPRLAGEALDTVRFTGSSFAFIGPADAELALPSINAHLLNCARTTFQGCRFLPPQADALEPPLSIANLGFLSFLDCALGGRHTGMLTAEGSPFWVTGPADRVLYQNCLTADRPTPAGPKTLTRISCRQQTRSLQEPPFLLGLAASSGIYSSHRPYTQAQEALLHPSALKWVDGLDQRISLGAHDARSLLLSNDGSAFLISAQDILVAGDLIATDHALPGVLLAPGSGEGGPLLLGRVQETGQATDPRTGRLVRGAFLRFVPQGLAQALATLRDRGDLPIALHLVHFPRVHPPTQGKVQAGSRILTEVEIVQPGAMARPIPLDQAWAKSHRIAGQGIPAGAYVKSVDPARQEIEISLAAAGYSGVTPLHGAPLRQISVKAM